ncbi:CdiA C-terminal domain-containing protein [Zophobihabitans entericus]|uniref:tRNA nuclease CdiA C-terminal domain-containing protein n=1 Tax=Zophobihabitans entericus TaxID=1635327 RepID=A0A6G9IEM7_9GAMM|nr:hypothetical protein [Zophobihabitans entericus]QIQ22040.1 hypothetical protein IPMB12_10295 [Zophobihabitans entericus]
MIRIFCYFLLRFIILSTIFIFSVCAVCLFVLDITGYVNINWSNVFTFPNVTKLLFGGVITGIASWVMFFYQYKKSVDRGKSSLDIFLQNGYEIEINQISPLIEVPFYKINGKFFHNYAPEARDISYLLSGIKKIVNKSRTRNIVINLMDCSIDLNKAKKRILDKFNEKLDNILLIDGSGNVIKLK